MLDWINRHNLRTILWAGFGIVIGLTLLVGILSLIAQFRSIERIDKLTEVDLRIDDLSELARAAMLSARRAEKDFLLYRNEFGFDEAKSRYITQVQTHVADIREYMAQIRGLTDDPAAHRYTAAIEKAAAEYEAGLMKVVALYRQLGYVTTGIEGEMRRSVHAIESIVQEGKLESLMVHLLTLRRHEKDFILRGKHLYVKALAEEAARFQDDVAAAALPQPVKQKLGELLQEYLRHFQQYAEVTARIEEEKPATSPRPTRSNRWSRTFMRALTPPPPQPVTRRNMHCASPCGRSSLAA